MTQGDQKDPKEESTRTQEGHIAAARTKQHEGKEDTGRRTAGRGKKSNGEAKAKNKKEGRR